MSHQELFVTNHALVRYAERMLGMDVADVVFRAVGKRFREMEKLMVYDGQILFAAQQVFGLDHELLAREIRRQVEPWWRVVGDARYPARFGDRRFRVVVRNAHVVTVFPTDCRG